MIHLLFFSTILATEPTPESNNGTISMRISPPSFLYSKGMDFTSSIICSVLFALIILLTLSLKPDFKNYQMALLYSVGFYIGVYEVFFSYVMELSSFYILLPCIAIGAIMSLYEPTRTIIGSLGATYPTYMIMVSILNPQSKFIGLVLMGLIGACYYFLLGSATVIFERTSKSVIDTFLSCCILELLGVYKVFKHALTFDYFSFGFAENISRLIIILFLVFFTFVSPALSFISSLIFGEENDKSDKPNEETV